MKKKKLRAVEKRCLTDGDDDHRGLDLEYGDKKVGKARLSYKKKAPTLLEISMGIQLDDEALEEALVNED